VSMKEFFQKYTNATKPGVSKPEAIVNAKQPAASQQYDTSHLGQELAKPDLFGVRRPFNDFNANFSDPVQVARIINEARMGQPAPLYLKLAEQIEERDLHYRGLLATRKAAITGLPLVVQAAGDDEDSKTVAAAVKDLVDSPVVRLSLTNILDAITKGYSVNEIIWDTSKAPWVPSAIKWRRPEWFRYLPEDGQTLVLLNEDLGFTGTPLADNPGKWIVHEPVLKSGLQIMSGVAILGVWGWLLKSMALKDWAIACEVLGMPIRLGVYKEGTRDEDIQILKRAVEGLSTDAAAVMKDTMRIEFPNAKSGSTGPQMYHEFCSYIDEQMSKLIVGVTLTNDSAGGKSSMALGRVHKHVRDDIIESDAYDCCNTIIRDLITPFVRMNFGDATPIPQVTFEIVSVEDKVGLANALKVLVPLGLKVSQAWVREEFDIPHPKDGEEILTAVVATETIAATEDPPPEDELNPTDDESEDGAPAASPPGAGTTKGTPKPNKEANRRHSHSLAHLGDDKIDGLVGGLNDSWQVADPLKEYLAEAAAGATTVKEMSEAMTKALRHIPPAKLKAITDKVAAARTKARAAGTAGADL
jgi:phage gp29-like protein